MPILFAADIFEALKRSCGDNPSWTADLGFGITGTLGLRQIVDSIS